MSGCAPNRHRHGCEGFSSGNKYGTKTGSHANTTQGAQPINQSVDGIYIGGRPPVDSYDSTGLSALVNEKFLVPLSLSELVALGAHLPRALNLLGAEAIYNYS